MPRVSVRVALVAIALIAFAGTPRAEEAPDVRLGRDVVPTFESVRLRLDADRDDYSGSVHVDLHVEHATSVVRLHARGQSLDRLVLRQGADSVGTAFERGANGLLTLTLAKPLAPGSATLDLSFHAPYNRRAVALYKVVKDGRGYLFTQFESDDAREAFPCWDEPGFKQPWQVTLEVPAAHEAVSNTPIASQATDGGWKTVTFEKTVPLPSYLVAIATGPLEFTDVPGSRVPLRIVTVQGQKSLTGMAADVTPKLVAGLERWFGSPYPYAKLDLIAIPEFAYGAMENAGAITFRDAALLVEPSSATESQRLRVTVTICHELAHMWFGDLVTMAWWDDLWLNESFADWMAAKMTDIVYPDFQYGLGEQQEILRILQGDALPSTRAIRADVGGSAAGLQNVGLVYKKGNGVLSTFESYLGPEVFQKGVRDYLQAHRWGNATAADLWKALDAASGQNVSAAMATFTDQPGLPLVRVTPADGGLRLTQSRCTPWGVSQPAQRWRIPIALRWSDGRTVRVTRVMLTEESQLVKLPATPAWVMPDAGGRGYYAWSAPGEMLEAVAAHAVSDLEPAERIEFLGNLDLLLRTGDVHADAYLRALAHFGSDPEPQVLAGVLTSLGSVRRTLVPDSLRPQFAPYVRQTLRPALDRFGPEHRAGESEAVGSIRGSLVETLVRSGEDASVEAFAREASARYLADPASVDPSVVDAALALAARRGDAAMFADFQRRFEASTVPAMRSRWLGALGSFGDSALADRALDYSLTDAVRATESGNLLRGFGDRTDAESARLQSWIMRHYDAIARRMPPPFLRFLPMTGAGCSEERLAATRAFFGDPARAFPGAGATLDHVSALVHDCISLRTREGPAAAAFLRAFGAK
jgi:alanyl aminopeptidase